MEGETDSLLVIGCNLNVMPGTYTCKIINDLVPDLTLWRRSVFKSEEPKPVRVKATVYLDGPFNFDTYLMDTDLAEKRTLAL